MSPQVSILVPSYNHARFLREALGGVLAQTFEDWELILVDDCSRDDSVEVARSAADPRIQVHVNERNLGTYGTLQRALEAARGQYVAVLDSDDLWAAQKLERQVAVLESEPEARFAYVLGWRMDAEGRVDEAEDPHANWPVACRQELLPHLLDCNRVLASGVVFRREGLRFETTCRYSGDWVALLRASLFGPCACVPERLTYWRIHGANTFTASHAQMVEEIRVRESIARFDGWFVPRLGSAAIRAGLGVNALNLIALHALFLNGPAMRRAALSALRFHVNKSAAARRALPAFFAPAFLRKRLWAGKLDLEAGDLQAGREAVRRLVAVEFR